MNYSLKLITFFFYLEDLKLYVKWNDDDLLLLSSVIYNLNTSHGSADTGWSLEDLWEAMDDIYIYWEREREIVKEIYASSVSRWLRWSIVKK